MFSTRWGWGGYGRAEAWFFLGPHDICKGHVTFQESRGLFSGPAPSVQGNGGQGWGGGWEASRSRRSQAHPHTAEQDRTGTGGGGGGAARLRREVRGGPGAQGRRGRLRKGPRGPKPVAVPAECPGLTHTPWPGLAGLSAWDTLSVANSPACLPPQARVSEPPHGPGQQTLTVCTLGGLCVFPAHPLRVPRGPAHGHLSDLAEQGRVFVSCVIDGAIIGSISTS